jgi:hypothetical protein
MKRGPAKKIPDILLDVVACHTGVSQVGDGGELRGRDIKRIMNAAVIGTKFENKFKVESAWKKLWKRHPERLQAAKIVSRTRRCVMNEDSVRKMYCWRMSTTNMSSW